MELRETLLWYGEFTTMTNSRRWPRTSRTDTVIMEHVPTYLAPSDALSYVGVVLIFDNWASVCQPARYGFSAISVTQLGPTKNGAYIENTMTPTDQLSTR